MYCTSIGNSRNIRRLVIFIMTRSGGIRGGGLGIAKRETEAEKHFFVASCTIPVSHLRIEHNEKDGGMYILLKCIASIKSK